jgi:REP element-mobilizing transposase RayT
VTIYTRGFECVFGGIVEVEMHLSPIGEIACEYWMAIPQHSQPNVKIDTFIVMPNHVHGIIVIGGGEVIRTDVVGRDVACNVSTDPPMSTISPPAGSLGAIVRSYKSAVTRWTRMNGYAGFAWQERYYDHLIRSERTLEKIRGYIVANPARWDPNKDYTANLWM